MTFDTRAPTANATGVAAFSSSAPTGNAAGAGPFWPSCRVASTANLASLAAIGLIDGVRLDVGDRVLLKDQSTAAQNGIYAVDVQGSEKVTGSQTFADGVTPITVSSLTAGVLYKWVKGANTVSLTNGTQVLTQSGTFIAAGTSVTLLGNAAATCLDSVKACGLSRATDAATSTLTSGRRVAVTGGAVGSGLWQVTGGTYTIARPSAPATITP